MSLHLMRQLCHLLLMLHIFQASFAQDKALCKEELRTVKMRTFLSSGMLGLRAFRAFEASAVG